MKRPGYQYRINKAQKDREGLKPIRSFSKKPIIIGVLVISLAIISMIILRSSSEEIAPMDENLDTSSPILEQSKGVNIPSDRAYIDKLDEGIHDELVDFTQWVKDNNAEAVIGEAGWPSVEFQDGELWSALASKWLADIAQTNIPTYFWSSGGHWPSTYNLSTHLSENGLITDSNSQAKAVETLNITTPKGVNLAGLEFGTQDNNFSNTFRGSDGNEYFYNNEANYAKLAELGYKNIRLPFRWERIQPNLKGPLDSQYLSYIQSSIDNANKYGLSINLDLHNYGRYYLPGKVLLLGSEELTHDDLIDVWTKISDAIKGKTGDISYGIMNEPYDLPVGMWNSSANNWEVASQSVIEVLRNKGDQRRIFVSGYHWAKLSTWRSYHADAWINDPINNFAYEAHHYWDNDTSGSYESSYDSSLQRR